MTRFLPCRALLFAGLTTICLLAVPHLAAGSVLIEHDPRSFVGDPLRISLWGRPDGESTTVEVRVYRGGNLLVQTVIDAPSDFRRFTLIERPSRGSYQVHLYGGGGWNGHALTIRVLPRPKAGRWRSCGDQKGMGAGFYNVHARNIGCKKARGVARKWFWGNGWETGEFWGFSCKYRRTGYELSKVRCTRVLGNGRRQIVKFEAGA